MSEILIHIGLHKTGTTALQQFFAANEAVFNGHGVFFPEATREKRPGQIIHSNLSWELRGHGLFDSALGTFSDLLGEIERRRDVKRWIISSEGLSRMGAPGDFLRRFKSHRVRVVAYLRDPVDAAPSLYTEQLKAGRGSTFDHWLEKRAVEWLDHGAVLGPWRKAGTTWLRKLAGRPISMIEKTLDREKPGDDALTRGFLDLLDLGELAAGFRFESGARINPRISGFECAGLLFLNHLLRGRNDLTDARKIELRRNLRVAIRREFPAFLKPFEQTAAQADTVRAMFGGARTGTSVAAAGADGPEEAILRLIAWLPGQAEEFQRTELDAAAKKVLLFARQQHFSL